MNPVNIDRIRACIEHIPIERSNALPGRHISGPEYHIVAYRGVECGVIRCLDVNTAFAAYVKTPPAAPLHWPERHRQRPFGVGVDFEWQDDSGATVRGFHTKHLRFSLSVQGVGETSVDTLMGILFEYITLCQRAEPQHEHH